MRLTASKLKDASDVVQDYLDELSSRARQAAGVGRPDSAAAQESVTLATQTVKMQLLQSQSVAEAIQDRLASLSRLRSLAEAGPGSSSSVVQCTLLAVSGSGHSWSV